MDGCYNYMYVYVSRVQFPQRSEEGFRSPENWSFRRLLATKWVLEINPGPLKEQSMFFIAGPLFQAQNVFIKGVSDHLNHFE